MIIGMLPKSLEIDGQRYPIHSDYRVALLIFKAYRDERLSDFWKAINCLRLLYKENTINNLRSKKVPKIKHKIYAIS